MSELVLVGMPEMEAANINCPALISSHPLLHSNHLDQEFFVSRLNHYRCHFLGRLNLLAKS